MANNSKSEIIAFLKNGNAFSSKEIFEVIQNTISYATTKRLLNTLVSNGTILKIGAGKSTKYKLSLAFDISQPVNIDEYYSVEIDDRKIIKHFNLNLITNTIPSINIFSELELQKLNELQYSYLNNISDLSNHEYKKELERLAIDLSWKSSQIEGNTYSLLETEQLLKEKETASGKTKDEATMLLNHKEAIDFLTESPGYLIPLSISKIEDIHSILIKELGVNRNIRKRRVGISGTNYQPLDNEFQIREALVSMCNVINQKENIFEKAFLVLILLSYIQPFNDGNKRTARIVSNAILMNYKHCPLSFRTINSVEYKKSMLIFYEQNNFQPFKKIFTDQFEFAVKTYF